MPKIYVLEYVKDCDLIIFLINKYTLAIILMLCFCSPLLVKRFSTDTNPIPLYNLGFEDDLFPEEGHQ